MATLTRTPRAQRVIPRFYGSVAVIWVEGQDDVAFWEAFYDKLGIGAKVKFSRAGNCTQLDIYIDNIINEGSSTIVMRDRDYITSNLKDHPRVIYTFGHSLESTLYSPKALSSLIALMARTRSRYAASTERWLEKFANDLRPLIELEISNENFGKRLPILGLSGARFLKGGATVEIDTTLVNAAYSRLSVNFDAEEIKYGKKYVSSYGKPLYNLVRGHFLTTPVKRYLNITSNNSGSTAKKTHLDEPQIFVALVAGCEPDKLQPREKTYLINSLRKAFKDIGVAV